MTHLTLWLKSYLLYSLITLHLHRGFENGKLYKLCILLLPTGSNLCMTSVPQLFEFNAKHRVMYCQLKTKYMKTRLWNLPPSSESPFSCIGSASYCSGTKKTHWNQLNNKKQQKHPKKQPTKKITLLSVLFSQRLYNPPRFWSLTFTSPCVNCIRFEKRQWCTIQWCKWSQGA